MSINKICIFLVFGVLLNGLRKVHARDVILNIYPLYKGGQESVYGFYSSVRLEDQNELLNNSIFEWSYEVSFLGLEYEIVTFPQHKRSFRIFEGTDFYSANHKHVWMHNLDRLYYKDSYENFDFLWGRQAIDLGISKVFSPLDKLSPKSNFDVMMEYRYGIDALRYIYYTESDREYDLGLVFGENFDIKDGALFAKVSENAGLADLKLQMMLYKQIYLGGLQVEADFLTQKFYFEGAYNWDSESKQEFSTWVMGFDFKWAFLNQALFSFEYFKNTSGLKSEEDYSAFILNPPASMTKGNVYYLGRDYLYFGTQLDITPLANIQLSLVKNMSDLSSLSLVNYSYSLAEDLYVSLMSIWPIVDQNKSQEFSFSDKITLVSLKMYM